MPSLRPMLARTHRGWHREGSFSVNVCWMNEAVSVQFGHSLVEQKNACRGIIHELLERGLKLQALGWQCNE